MCCYYSVVLYGSQLAYCVCEVNDSIGKALKMHTCKEATECYYSRVLLSLVSWYKTLATLGASCTDSILQPCQFISCIKQAE
jgi:hypothetical protein